MNIQMAQIPALKLAEELLLLEARTKVVAALTGLTKPTVIRLSRDISGGSPTKGQNPSSPNFYTNTIINNAHASIFLAIYSSTRARIKNKENENIAESLIDAYKSFRSLVRETPVDFNRAFYLTRVMRGTTLKIGVCHCCESEFIVSGSTVRPGKCPGCVAEQSFYCQCGARIEEQLLGKKKRSKRCPKCKTVDLKKYRLKRNLRTDGYYITAG